MTQLNTGPLWEWVNERHAIYLRKGLREGKSVNDLHVPSNFNFRSSPEIDDWPFEARGCYFTLDPVLQKYRFCNVFRELDRVTQWIERNIRVPFADHRNLWFMLAIARYINWPPTLQFLMNRGKEKCGFNAWPDRDNPGLPRFAFTPKELGDAIEFWKATGNKVYTGAYMIRAESDPKAEWFSWPKAQYIARIVLGRLWEDRELIEKIISGSNPTMEDVWRIFQQKRYVGWGPFMAYQVVVDMRWTRYLRNAPDINTWASLGPGSTRGLNRLAGRALHHKLSQEQGLEEMIQIWEEQDRYRADWVPPIDLSDIQNCLCETDKLLRVRNGEGMSRAKYIPGRGY